MLGRGYPALDSGDKTSPLRKETYLFSNSFAFCSAGAITLSPSEASKSPEID
jgi:hypothetical protein